MKAQLPACLASCQQQPPINVAACPAWQQVFKDGERCTVTVTLRHTSSTLSLPALEQRTRTELLAALHPLADLGAPIRLHAALGARAARSQPHQDGDEGEGDDVDDSSSLFTWGQAEVQALGCALGSQLVSLQVEHCFLQHDFWPAVWEHLPRLKTLTLWAGVRGASAGSDLSLFGAHAPQPLKVRIEQSSYDSIAGPQLAPRLAAWGKSYVRQLCGGR